MASDPSPRRILLLARDMVGDLVNTTGAVACFRRKFPEAHFVLEGGASAKELFPEIEIWIRRRSGGLGAKVARALRYRSGRFDMAIVLTDSHELARMAKLAGVREIVGVHHGKPELFTKTTAAGRTGHDLFPLLRAVLALVGAQDDMAPRLPIEPNAVRGDVIALHVGASDVKKAWPLENWIALAKRLSESAKVVVLGGPGEAGLVDQVAAAAKVESMSAMGLIQLAEWLQTVKLLVVADTGPAHLAAAVGTPTVVLYGPTDPARYHPWGDRYEAIWANLGCEHYGRGAKAAGCQFLEGGVCIRKCMRALTPEMVAERVLAAYGTGSDG